jgi:hemin uptake protein HemP
MKQVLVIMGSIAAVLFLLAGGTVGFTLWRMHSFISQNRNFLLQEVDHHAIAAACLTVLDQTNDHSRVSGFNLNDPSTPEALRKLGSSWAMQEDNTIIITHIGGHYHMGYIFRPLAGMTGSYELVFLDEGGRQNGLSLTTIERRR